jgi:uncharacterized protein (UPF0261 family)
MTTVVLLGTLDSKSEETAFVRDELLTRGISPLVIDVGVLGEPGLHPDIDRREVAVAAGAAFEDLLIGDRTTADVLSVMARGASALLCRLYQEGAISGVMGLGGGKGTALIAEAMRALPIGFPKVIVSPNASGNTERFVGSKDIWMVSPVTDLMGLNRINRRTLAQGAAAICAMATLPPDAQVGSPKPAIALTSYGVTTPAAERCKALSEQLGFEVLVFHARGTGGRAMEELIRGGTFVAVLDLTLSELADEVAGGTATAGPHRLEAAGETGIPQVVAPGALDVINFGPPGTVPERYAGRLFYPHSTSATLMRTNAAESARLGQLVAAKLNLAKGPVTVLIPSRGFSALDAEGKPFHDPAADAAFVRALQESLSPEVTLIELPCHVNDPAFADQMVQELARMVGSRLAPGGPEGRTSG